jgi:hypothetical protein
MKTYIRYLLQYEGTYYQPKKGIAMGSPISQAKPYNNFKKTNI